MVTCLCRIRGNILNVHPLKFETNAITGNAFSYFEREMSQPSSIPVTAYFQRTAKAFLVSDRTTEQSIILKKNSAALPRGQLKVVYVDVK